MTKKGKPVGLEPRGFKWVIAGRLAVSERIGGHGFQHRRVRREEEILWLKDQGVNTVVTLLPSTQNLAAYQNAGFQVYQAPTPDRMEPEEAPAVFAVLDEALSDKDAVVLVHRDLIDDTVTGLLGGYLVHAGLVDNPILATDLIQAIVGRALGPEGRRLIPTGDASAT